MSDFKWRHFQGEIILGCVRWYCKYGISYRELEEMMEERGVEVDHTTIYRWVQRYAPELEKRLKWYWKRPSLSRSWRVDETYVKVEGKWVYLYRAVDKQGRTKDARLISIYRTHVISKQPNDSWAKLCLDSKSGKNLRLSTPINRRHILLQLKN